MRPFRPGLACVLLLFGASQSLAYKGFEHHDVSNFALGLCLELLRQPSSSLVPEPVDPLRREMALAALQRLQGPETQKGRHYGDLVVSVDHYRNLSRFLEVKEGQFFGNPADAHRAGRLATVRRRLLAVHGNDNHFQYDALAVFEEYHREALRLAAQGDLQKALLNNAVADHFLQDFLASGHVVTPREQFHDMTSASVHDFYNKHGAVFEIDTREPWQRLAEIARAAQTLPEAKPDGASPECKRKRLDFTRQELQGFIERMEQAASDGKASLVFYGDGALRREIDQRSFVTLVVARSILDVVLSYLQGSEVDQVGSGDWCWDSATMIPQKPDSLCFPKARIAFGAYDLEARVSERARDPRKEMKTDTFFVQGLMLSVSAQISEGGLETGRRRVRLDYIPAATSPKGSIMKREPHETDCAYECLAPGRRQREAFDDSSVILLWGYTFMQELETQSHGPYMGALAPLGRDGQVRWWLGYRSFEMADRDPKKLVYGIGYEKGFGLLFLHADVERDFEFDARNSLQPRWTPSVGVNLMVPMSWLRFLVPG